MVRLFFPPSWGIKSARRLHLRILLMALKKYIYILEHRINTIIICHSTLSSPRIYTTTEYSYYMGGRAGCLKVNVLGIITSPLGAERLLDLLADLTFVSILGDW